MRNTKAGLKPYPAYKELEIPWLEKVPTHWTVAEAKNFYEIQMGKMLQPQPAKPTDVEAPYLKAMNVQWYSVQTDNAQTMWASPEEIEQLQVIPGDLLVCEGGEGGRAGIVQAIPNGFIIQNALHRVRPKRTGRNEFLQHLMKVISETGWFDAINNKATIAHFTKEKFASLPIPVPPLDEQAAIVRYLDDAGQRIRAYVSAKERLIALLEEERQATIHQAVTRGLDPNVKLKPSGVEWLGDVPEHWEVRRIRTLGQAVIGLTYSPQDMVDKEEGRLVLRASNISGGQIVDADNVYVRSPVPDKLILREGDILICSRSGSRNLIGKNARIANTSLGVTFGAFMTILRGPNNDYLHQVFNSKLFEYQSGAFLTSTINQLTLGILNDMKIPFPPAGEQQSILQYLNEATQTVDATIDRARRQIELMEEYRTRLIADVVTGKIDVRTKTPTQK